MAERGVRGVVSPVMRMAMKFADPTVCPTYYYHYVHLRLLKQDLQDGW
ncbi:hypothetical protein RUE5091_04162 [Ruegeria denitrificans]|uniref:Uncharacterized protein n=1 Tax=Ruegeria denitrificans TaxID=1715692 RepID=A0A0P1IJZ4_9RHOB|nr:hypothetical protein [Ruegeria denitrificans]CUK17801.1 hypothetical protein RUE5091_04162 [Ruegeria denitrificans]